MYRARYKAVQLTIKTHKTTFFITAAPEMLFSEAKEQILSALKEFPNETDLPTNITSTKDFELCVGRLNKTDGRLEFEVIDESKKMREVYGFGKAWDTGYIKFRDPTTGALLPVRVKFPKLVEDDDEEE